MIILYSTHCPRCTVLEKKLNSKGIKYDIVDDEDTIVNKGFMTVPMLEVDGQALDFGKAVKWVGEQPDEN